MSGQVIVPVEFLDVDDFRRNGAHLQQEQLPALDRPLDIHFFPERGPYLFPGLIEQPDLILAEQFITARTVAFTGNLIAMGRDLSGNQVFSLSFNGFDQQVRTLVRTGREQYPGFFTVDHLLDDDTHRSLAQIKAPGIIPYPQGMQGSQALLDALQQMAAVHEQASLVLAGIGSPGLIFIGS